MLEFKTAVTTVAACEARRRQVEIYEVAAGIKTDDAIRARLLRFAAKLGWNNPAVAMSNGRAARVANCQTPDPALYEINFKARRTAR